MSAIRLGPKGWRARVDGGFDEANVVRVAGTLGKMVATRYAGATVMVGYDSRRDSERLAKTVAGVLGALEFRVLVSDRMCPTPALDWAIAHEPSCIGGVMLTAGRMPFEYGGMLFRQEDGGPIDAKYLQLVEANIDATPMEERGDYELADLASDYFASLASDADVELVRAAGLRVVLDTMYGTGCLGVRELLEHLGCEVFALHGEAVPDFRGLHPDAREPWIDECEREVIARKADLGIVLNGDCGQFCIIDADGRMVSPHDLAPLVLEHVVSQRGQRGRVVATADASARIARQAERLDCDYTMVPVGFASLYREFADGDVILATDETGAICVPQHLPDRDGVAGALMLLELIAGSSVSVRELVQDCEAQIGAMEYVAAKIRLDFGRTQALENLLPGLNPPDVLGEAPEYVSHISGLRVELPDGSWMLLRTARGASGARAAAEAPTTQRANELLGLARTIATTS